MAEVKQSHLRLYNICFSVCFTLFLLGVIELGAMVALRFWDPSRVEQLSHDDQPVYRSEPWAREYWAEEGASQKFAYQSYVGWRQIPFSGKTITIDAEMHRKTANATCDGKDPMIWMFGGSTMWGTGSPDWDTIPSALAGILAKSGTPVCVRNFGQTGWRNTQELIELELELKRTQRRPDLVIFYDGFNDGYSFYQSGKIDVHMNFNSIGSQFEKHSSRQTLRSSLLDLLLSTHTARLISKTRPSQSLVSGDTSRTQVNTADAQKDLEVSYLHNLDIVRALAREYGFQYAFFWQPVIFAGHKHFTPDEQKILTFYHSRIDEEDVEYRDMENVLQRGTPQHMFDISNVFDGVSDTVFIDCVHVAPEGNELVAERMLAELHKAGFTDSFAKPVQNASGEHKGKRLRVHALATAQLLHH